MLAPVPLDSFNVTYLMECHPHSPTSNSVVDYSLIYLEEGSIDIFLDGLLYTCIYHEILTIDITEILKYYQPKCMGNTTSGCSGNIVNCFTATTIVSGSSIIVLQELRHLLLYGVCYTAYLHHCK